MNNLISLLKDLKFKIEWQIYKLFAIITGKTYNRNNLKLTCSRCDGFFLEHEHADHPDYKFPIMLDELDRDEKYNYYPSDIPGQPETRMPEWLIRYEMHPYPAFLGIENGKIKVIYECCYAYFDLYTGLSVSGFFEAGKYKIQDEYMLKIYYDLMDKIIECGDVYGKIQNEHR